MVMVTLKRYGDCGLERYGDGHLETLRGCSLGNVTVIVTWKRYGDGSLENVTVIVTLKRYGDGDS